MAGLLESLLSGAAGPAGSQSNPLLQIAMKLLSSQGGLSSLAQQFQRAGLGSQMNSWISSGQNLPVSAEQLTQVFGEGQLQQMAASSGLDQRQLSGGLSDLLPQLIDKLTPQGQVTATGLDEALASCRA